MTTAETRMEAAKARFIATGSAADQASYSRELDAWIASLAVPRRWSWADRLAHATRPDRPSTEPAARQHAAE